MNENPKPVELTSTAEDYLKTIWSLTEWSQASVTVTGLAARMELAASTVSETVKRLDAQGLVNHKKYAAITLTERGRAIAVRVVRRHRLIESFLYTKLGYTWDEVHDEAEVMEHAVSARFINALDKLLGYPDTDPHGDPIPTGDGEYPELDALCLAQAEAGQRIRIVRISDDRAEILQYLTENSLELGSKLAVLERKNALGIMEVLSGERHLTLPLPVANSIWGTLV